MKAYLMLIFSLCLIGLTAQSSVAIWYPLNTPKTWYPIDTLNKGVDTCQHEEWVSNEPYSYANGFGRGYSISCAAIHPPGTRCEWAIRTRKSICKKCLMHIVETDENPNPVKRVVTTKPPDNYEEFLQKLNKQ